MKTNSAHPRHVQAVLPAVFLILLAHLPQWLLRPYAALPQPIFELDLLIAVFIFTLNRWLGWGFILAAWCVSLLRAVAVNYHFHNVAEFLDTSRFAYLLSYSAFITPTNVAICAVTLITVIVLLRCLARTRSGQWPIVASIVMLALLDVLNGSGIARGRDVPFVPINVMGSPGYNLVIAERNFRRDSKQALELLRPLPPSYQALRSALERRAGSSLLILVESLGAPQSTEIRRWLLSQLDTLSLRTEWELVDGDEEFFGGTVAAELRVLCGLKGHYSRLTREQSLHCVPRLHQMQGGAATGMHGFSDRMFDRSTWWPIVGFTQTQFFNAWVDQHATLCPGAFNGVCDHDLVAAAIQLANGERQFVYALTINTHLPLPSVPTSRELQRMCDTHDVPEAACELVQAQGDLFADLALQMKQAPALLRQIVLVGDHSPPFHDYHARNAFKERQVPVIILTRRSSN